MKTISQEILALEQEDEIKWMTLASPFQSFTSVIGHSLLILYIWKVEWNSSLTPIFYKICNIPASSTIHPSVPPWGSSVYFMSIICEIQSTPCKYTCCMSHVTERLEVSVQKFSPADWCRCFHRWSMCLHSSIGEHQKWTMWNQMVREAQDHVNSENFHTGKNITNSGS